MELLIAAAAALPFLEVAERREMPVLEALRLQHVLVEIARIGADADCGR